MIPPPERGPGKDSPIPPPRGGQPSEGKMETVMFVIDLVFVGAISYFIWMFISTVVDLYEML